MYNDARERSIPSTPPYRHPFGILSKLQVAKTVCKCRDVYVDIYLAPLILHTAF